MKFTNPFDHAVKIDNSRGTASVTIAPGATRELGESFHNDAVLKGLRVGTTASPRKSTKKDSATPAEGGEAPSEDERRRVILDAVSVLMRTGDTAAITLDGKPRVPAIEQICGFDITCDERDAAWDAYSTQEAGG